MVGPSLDEDERRLANTRLKAGFVVLVGGSAGLIAIQGGATLVDVAVVTLAGLVIGLLLMLFLSRVGRDFTPR
ncbi:MAG: hypothetical protein ACQETI_10545 [Halobacteriota archaeon]